MTIKTWEQRMPARYPEGIMDSILMKCSCMCQEIDELRAELAKIKAQASIGEVIPCADMHMSAIATDGWYGGRGVPVYLAPGAQTVPDVDAMVNEFLRWKLPDDFSPDGGISFNPPIAIPYWWPVGTNLFTATQARKMVEAMLESAKEKP